MTFSLRALALGLLVLALTACGGDTDSKTENTIENRDVSTNTSTTTAASAPIEINTSEVFVTLPEPYKSADYNAGRRTYKLCQSCHTLNEGGQNLVGPNLYGVFGRQVGAVEGFTYSSAVQEADFIWTPALLEEWLTSPRNFLPGNKMSFAGVRKENDRHAVIAYIMAETGYTSDE